MDSLLDLADRAQVDHQLEHLERCERCGRALPALADEATDLKELVGLAQERVCPSGYRLLLAANPDRFLAGVN